GLDGEDAAIVGVAGAVQAAAGAIGRIAGDRRVDDPVLAAAVLASGVGRDPAAAPGGSVAGDRRVGDRGAVLLEEAHGAAAAVRAVQGMVVRQRRALDRELAGGEYAGAAGSAVAGDGAVRDRDLGVLVEGSGDGPVGAVVAAHRDIADAEVVVLVDVHGTPGPPVPAREGESRDRQLRARRRAGVVDVGLVEAPRVARVRAVLVRVARDRDRARAGPLDRDVVDRRGAGRKLPLGQRQRPGEPAGEADLIGLGVGGRVG